MAEDLSNKIDKIRRFNEKTCFFSLNFLLKEGLLWGLFVLKILNPFHNLQLHIWKSITIISNYISRLDIYDASNVLTIIYERYSSSIQSLTAHMNYYGNKLLKSRLNNGAVSKAVPTA